MHRLTRSFFLILVISTSAFGQSFTMNEGFLQTMIERNTLQPTFRVRMTARGPLHSLQTDCEMHVAGRILNASLGQPSAIVVEFPNWCKFDPQGNLGDSFNSLKNQWGNFADTNLVDKTCDVTGFLRIFTEHATGGSGGGSNPNHAYEFHPAMSMRCGNQSFAFENMLRAFPDLRHISAGTASNCLKNRRLRVRFRNNRYEFQESGGGSCGNFVIVRVSAIETTDPALEEAGHYAIATVTANGNSTARVGLYTLAPSSLDSWLRQVLNSGGGSSTKVIHGVTTYNWQSIIRTLTDQNGDLRRPSSWTNIQTPMAVIAYGETEAPF